MKKMFKKSLISLLCLILFFFSSNMVTALEITNDASTSVENVFTDLETSNDDVEVLAEDLSPFDFQLLSVDEDLVEIQFIPHITENSTFYLTQKGYKDSHINSDSLKYVINKNTEYSFVYTYSQDDILYVYNGTIMPVEYDNSKIIIKTSNITKNLTYNGDITRAFINSPTNYGVAQILSSSILEESEDNDTWIDADETFDNYDSYGIISSNDIDWWRITFDEDGEAEFWLDVPDSCDYELFVYHENQLDSNLEPETSECLAGSTNGSGQAESIVIDVIADTYYYVMVIPYLDSWSYTEYLLRVANTPYSEEDEFEDNNSMSQPCEVSNDEIIYATIHNASDVDYYKFEIENPCNLYLKLSSIPSDCDYDMILYDSSGTVIAEDIRGNDDSETIEIPLSDDSDMGWYYVYIFPFAGCYSNDTYRLKIEAERPDILIEHYMDQGYSNRFNDNITDHHNVVRDILEELFFINISRDSIDYISYADECKIDSDGSVTDLLIKVNRSFKKS